MSILLCEPFKIKVENFKQNLCVALEPLFAPNSTMEVTELFNGFHADSYENPLDSTADEMSSARFIVKVSNPSAMYCFDMVFDVISENPAALMQSINNNGGIVLRLDIQQGDSYVLVNSILITFIANLEKSIDWSVTALKHAYAFLNYQAEVQQSTKVINFLNNLSKSYFYIKNIPTISMQRGRLRISTKIDAPAVEEESNIEQVLLCQLCIASSNIKHIEDFAGSEPCKWVFTSAVKRQKVNTLAPTKSPLRRIEKLSVERLDTTPSIDCYISMIDKAVAHYYHYFNAP